MLVVSSRVSAFVKVVAFALCTGMLLREAASAAAARISSSPHADEPTINLFEKISKRWYNRNFAEHMLFGLEIELLVDKTIPPEQHRRYVAGRIVDALGGRYDEASQKIRGTKVGEIELRLDKSPSREKAVEIITRPLSLEGVAQMGKLLDHLGDDKKIFDTAGADAVIGMHINVATGLDRTHAQLVTNAGYNYYTHRRKLKADEPSSLAREDYIADITPQGREWLEEKQNRSFFSSKRRELELPERIISSNYRSVNLSYVTRGGENRIEFRYPDTVLGSTDPQSKQYQAGSRHLRKHIRFIAALMHVSSLGRIDAAGELAERDPAGLLGTVPDSKRFLRKVDKAVRQATAISGSNLSVMTLDGTYRLLSANRHTLAGPFDEPPTKLGRKLLVTYEPGHGGKVLRNRKSGEIILAGFDRYEELDTKEGAETDEGLFVAAEKSGLRYLFFAGGHGSATDKGRSVKGTSIALPMPGGKAGVVATELEVERGHLYFQHGREIFILNTGASNQPTFSGPFASRLERMGWAGYDTANTLDGKKALFFAGAPIPNALFDSIRPADPVAGFLSIPQFAIGQTGAGAFLISSDKVVSPDIANDYVKQAGGWFALRDGRYLDIEPKTLRFSKQAFDRVKRDRKGIRIGYDNKKRYLLDQRDYFKGGSEEAVEIAKIRSKFDKRLQVVYSAAGDEQVIYSAGALLSGGIESMRKIRGRDMALLQMRTKEGPPAPGPVRLNLRNNMIDAMSYRPRRLKMPRSTKPAGKANR